ncbi:hypothetical protein AYM40_06805 [Paraburkholderia phytofirmans OLGA172]|uniref:Uncharacterized protein n=1 Tax=Paraburkholderia phytofirmans OLGA172 TaxID=1417228 RepID=A0A160FIQ5_9BURK|nr:hypothetical protein AYM40_06805 [Paraburkholderia phytofirmans OLGA172]
MAGKFQRYLVRMDGADGFARCVLGVTSPRTAIDPSRPYDPDDGLRLLARYNGRGKARTDRDDTAMVQLIDSPSLTLPMPKKLLP